MPLELKKLGLSGLMERELNYIPDTGHYGTVEDFLKDAVLTLLSARRDIRLDIACRMYEAKEISLGKASEISGLNMEDMKEVLFRKGIARGSDESEEELWQMAKDSIYFSKRS